MFKPRAFGIASINNDVYTIPFLEIFVVVLIFVHVFGVNLSIIADGGRSTDTLWDLFCTSHLHIGLFVAHLISLACNASRSCDVTFTRIVPFTCITSFTRVTCM